MIGSSKCQYVFYPIRLHKCSLIFFSFFLSILKPVFEANDRYIKVISPKDAREQLQYSRLYSQPAPEHTLFREHYVVTHSESYQSTFPYVIVEADDYFVESAVSGTNQA